MPRLIVSEACYNELLGLLRIQSGFLIPHGDVLEMADCAVVLRPKRVARRSAYAAMEDE